MKGYSTVAGWSEGQWQPTVVEGVPRRDRRTGAYLRYIPDPLEARPLTLDSRLARTIADAERAVRALNAPGAESLASIARFLLRSEAIASSRIEGVTPSAKQVALAELGRSEHVRGVSEQAQLVANNMTVVREATSALVDAKEVTVDDIIELHRALMPENEHHHGLRTVQNWIGGSDWHPIDAEFVPPPAELVSDLMSDLVDDMNGAAHSPLVQAALVHAQFETIHPFTDGNGRVGRALIHTVLARRGLMTTAILPISLVLSTWRDRYVAGLVAYRYDGDPAEAGSIAGVRAWISTFVEAAESAAAQSADLAEQVEALRAAWTARVASHRESIGRRATPRADSASARLLRLLPEAPVVTASTLQRILDVSFPAASTALDELRQAGVVTTFTIERNATAYLATEVLDLITVAERRLASTKADTRTSPPNRPVPARAHRRS